MTFVVPSQRETVPWATSNRLSNSLLNRANTRGHRMSWTSPVSSSTVTNTVPDLPLGCCRATGHPATTTASPSRAVSTAAAGSTSGRSRGRTNSMTCPFG